MLFQSRYYVLLVMDLLLLPAWCKLWVFISVVEVVILELQLWAFPSTSPSNYMFSDSSGVNVTYFASLLSLIGLALGLMGGKYSSSGDRIIALSVSIYWCSASSSLSLMGWASIYGSTGFFGFLSYSFLVLFSRVVFFLGDLRYDMGNVVVPNGVVASITPSISFSSNNQMSS